MEERQKNEIFIRSDGWVFSKEGMERLKEGGYKGFARFKASMESQLGKWHRISRPLDKDAAEALKTVKGFVARGKFLSSAITKELKQRSDEPLADLRSEAGKESPAVFMRLTLTENAYRVVEDMNNIEFRDFVSNAIFRNIKK